MRIKSSETIAGQPTLAMRKFLKGMQGYIGTAETIAEHFKVNNITANQIMQDLLKEEYIETHRDIEHWQNTIKGNALANATARKPINRKTADRLLKEFLERVREVNDGNYAYRVKQVIIFGSYLSDSPTLGDIDLSLVLEKRYNNAEQNNKLEKERINAAHQRGKTFKTYLEQLFWPHEEVLKYLKNRSPSISLHEEENEKVLIPSKILFDNTNSTQ